MHGVSDFFVISLSNYFSKQSNRPWFDMHNAHEIRHFIAITASKYL